MADDVAEIINELGLDRYTLVGHSMGGKVAQALAARRPPGLSQLLLIAPSPLSPEPMEHDARERLRDAWGDPKACREILNGITVHALSTELSNQVIDDNLRASPAAWKAWVEHGSREDLAERYRAISVPTAVLAGERDLPLSPNFLRRAVVERIAGASLSVVPDAAHLLPLEATQSVAEFIRAYAAPGGSAANSFAGAA